MLSAAVKSIEDHGYILDTGIPDTSGFLSFKETRKIAEVRYRVGQLVDVYVTKLSSNQRTCNLGVDPKKIVSNSVSDPSTILSCLLTPIQMTEVSNVTSVLPGALVQSLVTTVSDHGLKLQILGYFDGTIDLHHLPTRDPSEKYKVGQKVKARVLYELPASSPPKFALSLADHVLSLQTKQTKGSGMSELYPIGTILDSVKIVGVEGEHGVAVEVMPNVTGFVHVSPWCLSSRWHFPNSLTDIPPLRPTRPCAGRKIGTLETRNGPSGSRDRLFCVRRLPSIISSTFCSRKEILTSF